MVKIVRCVVRRGGLVGHEDSSDGVGFLSVGLVMRTGGVVRVRNAF